MNVIRPLTYDFAGQPVWAQGVHARNPNESGSGNVQVFNSEGLCPSCIGDEMDLGNGGSGTVGYSLGASAHAWLDLSTSNLGSLEVGSPSDPLPLARITSRLQLLSGNE